MQLSIVCGTLLLVFVPAVPAKGRRLAAAGTVASVLAFDIIRLLTGAAALEPVLGGWLTGVAWLGATFEVFRRFGSRTLACEGLGGTGSPSKTAPR